MREILFRGKIEQSIYEPIAENGWVYGNYIECLDDHWRNIDENGNDITETRPMIFTIIESKGMKQHIRIPIIPKTLGQYTGITDTNGSEIFEGDIVEVELVDGEYFATGYVRKDEASYVVFGNEKGKVMNVSDSYEIVGNIHDNSDIWEEIK
jgi:uncharacterized phage protein (TIGR01671 family)